MSYNPYSLEGKTILVTGASSGIGKATAIECSKLGARVIITGRDEARLQQTLSSLEGEGHVVIAAGLGEDDYCAYWKLYVFSNKRSSFCDDAKHVYRVGF